MDADRFREEVLAELDRQPIDVDGARRSVEARGRRHRQRVSAGVVAAIASLVVVATGVVLARGGDDPSSLDVVSGGEDLSTTSTSGAPASELFFLVPDRIPSGMRLVDVSPPGDMYGRQGTATPYATQKWARFDDDGRLGARFDVTVSEGTLAEHLGEPTVVGAFPALFDAVAGALLFEDSPGHLVTVASRDIARGELEAVAATWVGGAGTSFTIQAPPGFELVVTEESEQATGPALRAALYGDGEARGFTIAIDEPINDLLGAERLSGGRATTIRGHEGVIAPFAVGIVGPSYPPAFAYLREIDLVLRWREGGSTVAVLAVGMTEDELLALAEDLQVGPVPPDPFVPPDIGPYCGSVATYRTTEEAIASDGLPEAYSSTIFEFLRTVAPEEAVAPLDVLLAWLRAGAPRPVPEAVVDAERVLAEQWAAGCTGYEDWSPPPPTTADP